MQFSSTAAYLLLVACCLQACCTLCEGRTPGTSSPPPEQGACPCQLTVLCFCAVSTLKAFLCARQYTNASTDFGPTFSACLQVECASKLEVSHALCAELYLLGFLQSSSQAELGFCVVLHAGDQLQCPPSNLLSPRKFLSSQLPTQSDFEFNCSVLEDASQIAHCGNCCQ